MSPLFQSRHHKLLKWAESRWDACRGVALQCGHGEAELRSGTFVRDDALLLLKCFDDQYEGSDGTVVYQFHPLGALADELSPKDRHTQIQLDSEAQSFAKRVEAVKKKAQSGVKLPYGGAKL